MGGNTRLLWTLIIIAAAVAATACAGCTSNTTQSENPSAPASFLQYTNKNAGVEMNYPSDWQLTGNPAVGTIARFEHGMTPFCSKSNALPSIKQDKRAKHRV
jgi:hypothetical protein